MEEFIKELIRKNFTVKTIKSRCEKQGWNPTNEEIESIRSKVQLELKSKCKNDDKLKFYEHWFNNLNPITAIKRLRKNP